LENLLLWRDVRKSGVVFALLTITYLLLEWSHISLLKIVSNVLLLTVVIAFLWSNIASYTNVQRFPIPAVIQQGISQAQIQDFAQRATVPTNRILAFAKRVLSGHDVVLSVQSAGLLYIFGRLGHYFSSVGLLYLVVVLAFSVPKIYELNKKEVDNVLNSVQKQSQTYYKQYAEPYIQKIPRASTSTANTGSVTANNHTGDSADSYAASRPPQNLQDQFAAANQGLNQAFNQGSNQGVKKFT
jgi:riboflavin kinase